MKLDEIITYGFLVQEYMCGYLIIIESRRWETIYGKKNTQNEPLLMKASTVAIEDPVNKTEAKVDYKLPQNSKKNME